MTNLQVDMLAVAILLAGGKGALAIMWFLFTIIGVLSQ